MFPLRTTEADAAIGVHAMVLLDRWSLLLELTSLAARILVCETRNGVSAESEDLRRCVHARIKVVQLDLVQLAALSAPRTVH
jgi:hypothetical protein